ncbi:MAG: sensor histidine kinase [Gaiellaceae bacterium]
MRSLRVRLPALFFSAVLVAGLVTAVVATSLFQNYTRDRTLNELRRQATGLAQLYSEQARQIVEQGQRAPSFAGPRLERAMGARLYYVGVPIFPGQLSGLREMDSELIDWDVLEAGSRQTFEFADPESDRTFLAVGQALRLDGQTFGALVVAKPKAQLAARFLGLLKRTSIALLGGLFAAGILGWWLSRRVTKPVLKLSRAAKAVANRDYDVELPDVRRDNEIGELAASFREMTLRLSESEQRERNFLMTVSHELRTPLTAIRGHVDALREGLADDPAARSASLDVVGAEADRLQRLVGDVLDLAKLEADRFTLRKEEVDLARLVEQAHASLAEEARRREIEFECVLQHDVVVTTDGDRLLQVVTNLLANALQWTPDMGRVELRLAADQSNITIAVEDSGPGITAELRANVFRPFFSMNGAGGTGLGLAIAHELAQALGGTLPLDCDSGHGTRFVLTLPAPQMRRRRRREPVGVA